jgi:hypothetical protein
MSRAGQDYRKWMPHNIKAIKKQYTIFINSVYKPKIVDMLQRVAAEIVQEIDSNKFNIPVLTSNLKDATGVAVYVDGRVSMYLPTKRATKLQRSGFHGRTERGIDGNLYLQRTINDASTYFQTGVWIVFYSAVPYAFYINDATGFFNATIKDLANRILSGLKPISESAAMQMLTMKL